MDAAFAGKMPGGFVGLYIGPGASLLVIAFAVVARRAGVPDGYVVSAGVTVIVVVAPLVRIGRVLAIGITWGGRNAGSGEVVMYFCAHCALHHGHGKSCCIPCVD